MEPGCTLKTRSPPGALALAEAWRALFSIVTLPYFVIFS